MKEPTELQSKYLAVISDFILSNGYPPTLKELADKFNVSVPTAKSVVKVLRVKGKITFTDRMARTIRIT